MLVVDFDPTRPRDEGPFHVRLIDAKSGDFGNDAPLQSQLGYWCDLGHLQSGVLRPVEAAVMQHDNAPRRSAPTEESIMAAIEEWYSVNYDTGLRIKGVDRRRLAQHLTRRLRLA